MNKAELAKRLRAIFQAELEQQVGVMNADLLALEKEPNDSERLKSLFRVAHSLKGAAAASEIPLIAEVCHKLETILSDARDGSLTLNQSQFAMLFAAADALEQAGRLLRSGGDLSGSELHALNDRLDRFVEQSAETPQPYSPAPVTTPGSPLSGHGVAPTERPTDSRHRAAVIRMESAKLDSMQSAVEQLSVAVGDVLSRLKQPPDPKSSSAVAAEARTLAGAQRELEEIMRVAQMRPFADACEALARVVRDVGAEGGKDVRLEITGGDVEAEGAVIDGMREALLQLVRNAVDHGIETPAARLAAGKPSRAAIHIDAALRGDKLRVTVADDGRGLDVAAVRQRLVELGRRVPENDREAVNALFEGGVSTRAEVTAISGRGVGLNLVRDAATRMHGTIRVDWEAGLGATFTIECPLTLSSIRALIVNLGPQSFAIPTATVSRVRRAGPESIRIAEGGTVLIAPEEAAPPIPVVSLARVLGPPFAERVHAGRVPTIVLQSPGGTLAAMVDEVVGEQQITIRRIDGRGAELTLCIGATVLAGGRVALVLNVPAVVQAGITTARAGSSLRQPGTQESRRRRVLVVDDSITTRTLEQSVLEAGGYDTVTAVDGAAAWQILNEEVVDLVLADVEMPRMDGFALCEAIRGSRKLAELPVVLVTALEKPEHRARGLEAGADAYIAKSSFDQKELLDTVQRMLG